MTYITKRKRKLEQAKERELEDLRAEKEKLEFLRDSRHVMDALTVYIEKAQLTAHDRAEIRKALLYLCRGE